jgi:hypothetical protein
MAQYGWHPCITSLDHQLLIMQYLKNTKEVTLMNRPTVQRLPLHLVFLANRLPPTSKRGANCIKLFWLNLLTLFCKLCRFVIAYNFLRSPKLVELTKKWLNLLQHFFIGSAPALQSNRIIQLLFSATSGLYYKSFTIIIYDCNVQFTIVMTVTSTIKLWL